MGSSRKNVEAIARRHLAELELVLVDVSGLSAKTVLALKAAARYYRKILKGT